MGIFSNAKATTDYGFGSWGIGGSGLGIIKPNRPKVTIKRKKRKTKKKKRK
jgi:hypothetical protein